MNIKEVLLILGILLGGITSFAKAIPHPIHVSKFTLKYSEKEQGYRSMLYLFDDDLELALNGISENREDPSEVDISKADTLLRQYIAQHLHVWSNEHMVSPEWIGKEASENGHAYWVYMFYPCSRDQDVRIENTIFTEVAEEQKNIIQFYDRSGILKEEVLNKDRIQVIFKP